MDTHFLVNTQFFGELDNRGITLIGMLIQSTPFFIERGMSWNTTPLCEGVTNVTLPETILDDLIWNDPIVKSCFYLVCSVMYAPCSRMEGITSSASHELNFSASGALLLKTSLYTSGSVINLIGWIPPGVGVSKTVTPLQWSIYYIFE